MSPNLDARLRRIEARMLPVGLANSPVLLVEPQPGADADLWARHQQALQAAQQDHDLIILVSPQADDAAVRALGKVRRVPDALTGMLSILAAQPSTQGRRSKLDDLLASLNGNVFRPMATTRALDDGGGTRIAPCSAARRSITASGTP